jgi:holo-[acyl-carrier protein] synthase
MIGIDMEYIPRFEKIYSKKMLKKIFNFSEWDYALKKSNTAQTLARIWCAKEAVVKAISHKKEVFIIDIIIKHKKSGQPYVTF